MAKLNKTVLASLGAIVASGRVTFAVGKPLVDMGLIEVNKEDISGEGDTATYASRLTQKGLDSMPKAPVQNVGAAPQLSNFAIMTGVPIPESKRGAGRVAGPSKYPFDQLPAGGTFFVAADTEIPDPLKTLGSAVSNATNKYRVDTGKTEMVSRTKRGEGNKAVLDAAGNKIKEQVQVPVYEYPRKFVIRAIKAGDKLGDWTAPVDGVLIGRTV